MQKKSPPDSRREEITTQTQILRAPNARDTEVSLFQSHHAFEALVNARESHEGERQKRCGDESD